jgi:hypothetical protein
MSLSRSVLVMALLAAAPACTAEDETAASYEAPATQWNVREASLGDSYDLEVAAKHGGEADNRHVVLLQFDATAGQRFAVVVRRADDSSFDAYLELHGESGEALATSKYDQAILPMAAESDAIIVHSATRDERFTVFVAELELAVDASIQVDLVPLDSAGAIDATLTAPGTRALCDALRADEAQLVDYMQTGTLSETGDGLLDVDLTGIALRERASLNGFVAKVNDVRQHLFSELARQDAASSEHGPLCAELWSALRSDTHALR